MLEGYSGRSLRAVAADYEPQVGFATKLSDAAEAIQAKLAAEHWGFGTGSYLFRDPNSRFLLHLDFRRVSCQTLGLVNWQKRLEEYSSILRVALDRMKIKTLKRVGFKVSSFLPLGLSHSEMADLIFGSYLLPAEELKDVCGKAEDALVQLHGAYKMMKLQLIVAPMSVEQASKQFLSMPNLEHFLEPKLLDTGVKEFGDRLKEACLYIDVDLARTDCEVADLHLFLKDSLEGTQSICEQAVLRFKSLKPKKR